MFVTRVATFSLHRAEKMEKTCTKKIDRYERKIVVLKDQRDWAIQAQGALNNFIAASEDGDSIYASHMQVALKRLLEEMPDTKDERTHMPHPLRAMRVVS
jgi:hypothetical protein